MYNGGQENPKVSAVGGRILVDLEPMSKYFSVLY